MNRPARFRSTLAIARRSVPLALAILLALSLPLTAQEPEAGFEEEIEVSEVLLDVVAVDRKGQVVRGLGPEDFQVRQGGEPVEITGVSFYTTRYGADARTGTAAGGGAVAEIPSSRYFIFFFHDQRRVGGVGGQLLRQQLDAGRQSARWIREEMQPSDWVAVVGFGVKLQVYQDFSQDRGALETAIDQAVRGRDAKTLAPSKRRRAVASGPSLLAQLPPQPTLGDRTPRMYEALQVLAEATGPLVGRKNVLLFTIGFGQLDGVGPFNRPDPRFYPETEEALNANNVAVYPIDLSPVGVEHTQTGFLNQLAYDTGGTYLRTFTSFITPLRRIAEENDGYYTLSFRAEHPAGERGYRQITVDATRPKVILRAPRGYRYGSPADDDAG